MANKIFKKRLTWNEKAKENPLYAIMSDPEFENSTVDSINEAHLKKFYQKGKWIWETYIRPSLNYLEKKEGIKVLEWGCGMGRILVHAVQDGLKSSGLDISEQQIRLLKQYFPISTLPDTCIYNSFMQVSLPDASFDLIYSYAVLQHIENTKELYFILNEMIRLLAKDGILRIQFRCINPINSRFRVLPFLTSNFKRHTLIAYLRKTGFIYIPVLRIIKHDHWSGAGSFVPLKKYMQFFKANRLDLIITEFENNLDQSVVWMTVRKK